MTKVRYMNADRRSNLACALFDRYIALRRKQEAVSLKTYEVEFVTVIEQVCSEKSWNQITKCDIHEHLKQHRNPEATIIEILKNLMED
jgi:hypothetical protein